MIWVLQPAGAFLLLAFCELSEGVPMRVTGEPALLSARHANDKVEGRTLYRVLLHVVIGTVSATCFISRASTMHRAYQPAEAGNTAAHALQPAAASHKIAWLQGGLPTQLRHHT